MSRYALILLAGIAWADRVDPPLEPHLFGTHSVALAGASVVGAQGVEALFVNPAGRVVGARAQAGAGVQTLSCGRTVAWTGLVIPHGSWGVSASWGAVSAVDIPLRDEGGALMGTASWGRHRIGAGVARALDFLTYAGLDVHYLRVGGAGVEADGFGVDAGVVRLVLPPLLAVGGAVHDVFTSLAYREGASRRETIRPRFTAGVKIGLAEGRVQMEWNLFTRRDWSRWRAMAGLQAKVGRGLVARIGYGDRGLTAGIGLSSGHVGIGYAMMPDGLGSLGRGVEAVWTR
ncbi:hypothetical protein JXA88_15200 [Candidatus Fermentibacteria bacterium]|nr:hypothetical protein [Candidatus Fermentibacteria bacterium]